MWKPEKQSRWPRARNLVRRLLRCTLGLLCGSVQGALEEALRVGQVHLLCLDLLLESPKGWHLAFGHLSL